MALVIALKVASPQAKLFMVESDGLRLEVGKLQLWGPSPCSGSTLIRYLFPLAAERISVPSPQGGRSQYVV